MAGSDVMPLPPDVQVGAHDLATDLARTAAMINYTQVALDTSGGSVPGWVGQSADAYSNEVVTLGIHARELAEVFAAPVSDLRFWADEVGRAITVTIPSLWSDYDDAQVSCENRLRQIESDATAALSRGNITEAASIAAQAREVIAVRDEVQKQVIALYEKAIDSLDDAAASAARAIRGAVDAYIDPAVVLRGRDAIGAELFNDMPTVDGQASWEQAQRVAPRIAEAMRDADLTDDDVRVFQEEYGDLLGDPFVANALMENMSAEELYKFVLSVDPDSTGGYTNTWEERESILRGLGTMMVLSTGGMNLCSPTQTGFEGVRGALRGVNGETMDELAAKQIADYQQTGRKVFDKVVGFNGYSLFSQLTGAAALGNTNLTLGAEFYKDHGSLPSMAADMVAWDHETEEGGKAALLMGQPYISFTDLIVDAGTSVRDPMHVMYLLSDTPDSLSAGSDLLLREAEEHRLEALRSFLTSDTTFNVAHTADGRNSHPMNMTRYLTGHRGDGEYGYFGFQDAGEAFGDMLADASRPDLEATWVRPSPAPYPGGKNDPQYTVDLAAYRTRLDDALSRTRIAAEFMVGYQDGLDVVHDTDGDPDTNEDRDKKTGDDVWGHINHRLRSWAGTILAPHIDSMIDRFASSVTAGSVPIAIIGAEENSVEIMFDDQDIGHFTGKGGIFEDLAFDDPKVVDDHGNDNPFDDEYAGGRRPALYSLRLAAQAGYARDLADATGQPTHTEQLGALTDAGSRWALLTDTLYYAPAGTEVAATEVMRRQTEEWSKGVGEVIGLIPVEELVDNSFMKWLIGDGADPLPEAMNDPSTGSTPVAAYSGNDEFETLLMMDEALYSELASEGVLTDKSGQAIDFSQFHADGNPGNFTDGQGNVVPWDTMTDEQKESFKKYVKATDYARVLRGLADAIETARRQR